MGDVSRKIRFEGVKRVVIKIGTTSITHETGLLNLKMIESLAMQVSDLHNRGIDVVLVSSGAIGAGMGKLNLSERPKTIPEKQAAAAVGQGVLVHMYQKCFSEYGKTIAQLLLTKDDISDRDRFLNARNACYSLLDQGVIPIVNENDAVVVDEIKYGNKIGDNDTLSALVVSLVDAEMLIILSDIDGLYSANPKLDKDAELVYEVPAITDEILSMCGDSDSKFGTGGMATKIQAATIANASNADLVIANAKVDHVVLRVMNGEPIGTLFMKQDKIIQARKRWIGYGSRTAGQVYIDQGAIKAVVEQKRSLLPSGIVKVSGEFESGETIEVCDMEGRVYAHGITNYSAESIARIKGLNTSEIQGVLGYKDYDEVIHINNLYVLTL